MFGMEKEKDKSKSDDSFDLENKLKDLTFYNEMSNKVMEKIQALKNLLRQGESKEQYDQLGIILQAYLGAQKVLKKAHQAKKK